MQHSHRIILVLLASTAPLLMGCKKPSETSESVAITNAPNTLSNKATPAVKSKALSVGTNDVLLIRAESGAVALVQFTSFAPNSGSYRWRYRAPNSDKVEEGKGQVLESYERTLKSEGKYEVKQKPDHDTTVRAGELTLQWSYGGRTNGWLYPGNFVEFKILGDGDAFGGAF